MIIYKKYYEKNFKIWGWEFLKDKGIFLKKNFILYFKNLKVILSKMSFFIKCFYIINLPYGTHYYVYTLSF